MPCSHNPAEAIEDCEGMVFRFKYCMIFQSSAAQCEYLKRLNLLCGGQRLLNHPLALWQEYWGAAH